ncbi:MAG: DNA-directed RNA polymerase subunit H [Candidatus Aenigmarchaeota archaeon]|nr:DNA-directed RNA polymerase subunit H [Candidatus Aenigmarchaeota archaeon]
MTFDILAHELVPKHEILSKKEKEELLARLGSREEHLPKIYESDPVIKVIKAKPKDVIKITRKSQTSGEAVYYRIVLRG